MAIQVSAFYKFVRIDDTVALRDALAATMRTADLRGTVLIASEGINGTVSGLPAAVAAVLANLRTDPRFADLVTKDATAHAHPFRRLKVKLKPEILTFGHPEADPSVRVGTYVAPMQWDALIDDPDVLLIDTRNSFEIEHGTFPGAVDPKTRRFSDFATYVDATLDPSRHRKIAMFCTGGIRCEKASAYLLAHGFNEVFHLQGGILNYLAQVPADQSRWQGACFVFDERETVASNNAPPDAAGT